MSPAFAEFFAKALPKDGGRHVLTLGELHNNPAHLKYLKEQLPVLKDTYGITSIGLEWSAFLNVFLWAYRDGTLRDQLGSQENAQAYLRAVFVACSDTLRKANAIAKADLAIAAMDAGIEVMGFDSRDILAEKKQAYSKFIKQLNSDVASKLTVSGDKIPADMVLSNIRQSRENLTYWDEYTKRAWILEEVDWLLGLKPNYQPKLNALEHVIAVGHQEIEAGMLTSDGLSAALEQAQMLIAGNSITIGGAAHIKGIGTHNEKFSLHHPEQIHGSFGQHLFAMGQATEHQRIHRVTAAMIATVAVVEKSNHWSKLDFSDPYNLAIAGHGVAWLNLDDGAVGKMWQPEQDHPCVVPLEEKFPVPDEAVEADRPAIHAAHLNPLKNPVIKEAFDALRSVMQGPSIVHDGKLGGAAVARDI